MTIRKHIRNIKEYLEFISFRLLYILKYRRINRPIKNIVFFPMVPHYPYVIYKLSRILGIHIKGYNTWEEPDLIIAFEDSTHSFIDVEYFIKDSNNYRNKNQLYINSQCKDISKKNVANIFQKIFNYNLDIDPLVYKGKVVKKSDLNATHDGQIIECPISKNEVDSSSVYSRLINNEIKEGFIEDLRVPIFIDEIPLVYKKHRKISNRFSNTNETVLIEEVHNVFTSEEIKKIISFTREIGLHIGEIDVLRDRDSQKIFIIDVNKTPAGPPNHLPKSLYNKVLVRLAHSYEDALLKISKFEK